MTDLTTSRGLYERLAALACVIGAVITMLCDTSVIAFAQESATEARATVFDQYFVPKTMRVDYYHCGNASEDRIALDRVVSDGVWAGSRWHLRDATVLGQYCFEVRDQASEALLFLRGYCRVFGEWQTTAEAKQRWGTFHASLRFPWPKQTIQVTIKRRVEGQWRELWTTTIDPASRFVIKGDVGPPGDLWTVFENGEPAEKVDVLFLGDGYTQQEIENFHAQVRRLTERLFEQEPFHARRSDFNVRAIDTPDAVSGVSDPRAGIFRRSILSCQYNTFDLSRYVLTFDNRTVRDVAAAAPYDYLIILLNGKKYGGGGVYNDQTTVAAGNAFADYIMTHEFGHHFAGLGDEYYISNVSYETGKLPRTEPWEPNVTALLDPAQLKWRDLVDDDVPIPTPWNKDTYESLARKSQRRRTQRDAQGEDAKLEVEFRQERLSMTNLLKNNQYAGKVGAFEGAAYEAKGLYRPAIDCVMFSRNLVGFCPVCRRAIEAMIDQHTSIGQDGEIGMKKDE